MYKKNKVASFDRASNKVQPSQISDSSDQNNEVIPLMGGGNADTSMAKVINDDAVYKVKKDNDTDDE